LALSLSLLPAEIPETVILLYRFNPHGAPALTRPSSPRTPPTINVDIRNFETRSCHRRNDHRDIDVTVVKFETKKYGSGARDEKEKKKKFFS
jgi:hypothetical protein